ncbi:UNVERIFIED_ORG: excisionase family DNA binding protein [Burkholderia sp. 1263]
MAKAITTSGVSPALSRFADLPNDAHVETAIVESLLGLSRATIARRVNSGHLPAPKKFGRSVRFNVGDLRRALEK